MIKKILLALMFIVPFATGASDLGLSYQSLGLTYDQQAIVQVKGLGKTVYYQCDLQKLTCNNKGTSTPTIYPESFKNRDLRLSPDGRYSYDVEFGVLYEIKSGELILKSQIPLNSSRRRVYWTSDSQRIIFILDKNIVTFDVASDRNLYKQPWTRSSAAYFSVSPSGRYAAFYTGKDDQRTFEIFDIKTGKSYTRNYPLQYWDLMEEEPKIFDFTPDDRRLIYLDDRAGDPNLFEVRLDSLSGASFTSRQILRQPGTVADFLVADNDTIYFIANRGDRLTWSLHKYNFSTDGVKTLVTGLSYSNELRLINNNKYLTFATIGHRGTELKLFDTKSGETKTLTGLPKITKDIPGLKIQSLTSSGLKAALWEPDKATTPTQTALIWLHGGPYRQTSLGYHTYLSYGTYDWIMENLAKSGIAILRLDYTGSYGYGRPFAEAIRYSVGAQDVRDVVAAQKYLTDRGYKNIYLMGNSYGGYLSLRTIVEQPKLFAGAISINGVTDWTSLLGNVPSSIFGVHFGGDTTKGYSFLYFQASILDRLWKLGRNQPILLFHGEADSTINPKQSSTLASLLKEEGKTVNLVTYPGQNHTFSAPEPIQDMCQKVSAFIGLKKVTCR